MGFRLSLHRLALARGMRNDLREKKFRNLFYRYGKSGINARLRNVYQQRRFAPLFSGATEQSNFMPNIVFSPQLLGEKNGRIYEKYIKPIICSAAHFQILSPEHAWQNKILQLLRQIFTLQTNEADCELSTVLLLLEIWKILFDHLPSQAEAHLNNGETLRNSQLQIMMQFIHKHYCEPISLKETSSAAFLSKNTALQRFRNGIRLSPVLYMIRYRLTRAAELLLTTESSVTHIAEQVGFESAGYFCRKFKECYKISPTEYRSKKSEK